MKLQIGPGNVYIPGWVNIDLFSSVRADCYANALAIPYPEKTFDIVYASHVLEHMNRHTILAALTHWKFLLKDGGTLRLSVPDFKAICEYYTLSGDVQKVLGLLYGGQRISLDTHKIAFDQIFLTKCLKTVGFERDNISLWDWQCTEHAMLDDYSQAYIPHMDKENGRLMSLNMEAIK